MKAFIPFTKSIGLALTPAQHALAAVSFDRAPVPVEFADLFGGATEQPSDARSIVWLCGRASGKTTIGAAAVLWRALTADLRALGKGEMAFGIVVAPDMKLAGLTLAHVNGWLENSALKTLVVSRTTDSVTLRRPDGRKVTIAVFAATRGGSAVRGKSIVAASLDEACFFRDTTSIVNDSDIYNALLPRLTRGAFIFLASTPWVQSGLVHSLYDSQFGKPISAIVAKAPTERMRTDDPEILATVRAERLRDPDNAAREFDCEWLAKGSGNAFDLNALTRSIVEAPPAASGKVYIGGDLGLVTDPSAFVAVQEGPDATIIVQDVLELKPGRGVPLSLTEVLKSAAKFAATYHESEISVDHHSLAAANDIIKQANIQLILTACDESSAGRENRFTLAIQAFKDDRIKLPKRFAHVTDQLARIVATPRSGGGNRFSAGRADGNHADAAQALLLAIEPILKRMNTIATFNRIDFDKMTAMTQGIGAVVAGAGLGPLAQLEAEREPAPIRRATTEWVSLYSAAEREPWDWQ